MKKIGIFVLLLASNVLAICAKDSTNVYSRTVSQDSINKVELTNRAIDLTNYILSTLESLKLSPTEEFCVDKKKEIMNALNLNIYTDLNDFHLIVTEVNRILSDIKLNEMDKSMYMRVAKLKEKNLRTQALGKALSTPMTVFSNPSMGINALLTLARAGVELAATKNELKINNEESLWKFNKANIEHIDNASDFIFEHLSLAYSYNNKISKNYDKNAILTPELAKQYANFISYGDPHSIISGLENSHFSNVYDYYYHLGMAYAQIEGEYNKAKDCFLKFEKRNRNNTIFKNDYKLGFMSLTRLLHEQEILTKQEIDHLIEQMIGEVGHIQDNDIAYIVASMSYMNLANKCSSTELKKYYKSQAYGYILKGLTNIYGAQKDDLNLVDVIIKDLDDVKQVSPKFHKEICFEILTKSKSLTIFDYTHILFSLNDTASLAKLSDILVVEKQKKEDDIVISVADDIISQMDSIRVYDVTTNNDALIVEYAIDLRGEKKDDIIKKIKKKCDKPKDIDEAFDYFFMLVNPADKDKGYCRVDKYDRKNYLEEGIYGEVMTDLGLLENEEGSPKHKPSEALNAIFDYCENDALDISRLVCKANNKPVKKHERKDDVKNLMKDWGLDSTRVYKLAKDAYHWWYDEPQKITDASEFFYGDSLIYVPSRENLEENKSYIQVVVGEAKPTQIIFTYTKDELKLVSCQQGNNYYKF